MLKSVQYRIYPKIMSRKYRLQKTLAVAVLFITRHCLSKKNI